MKQISLIATAHAIITVAVALWLAYTARNQVRVVMAVSYIAAAEVLWRMMNASVFWELGKYAVSATLLLAIVRNRPTRWNWLALAYLALLLPSVLLTCTQIQDISQLRNMISSNFSGPLSLAVCAFCLYDVRLTRVQVIRLLLAMLGPLTGLAAACSFATLQLGADYEFGNESNFDTSGGFGPNQVSSVLGFAILLAFLWTQYQKPSTASWGIGFVLVLFFFAQAALTFSRTGVWMGIITIMIASLFLFRAPGQFLSGILGLLILSSIGYFLVFPVLDHFTNGKLSQRFAEKGFSRREEIAQGDLQLALRYPILGVGLGMAPYARVKEFGVHGMPHTEFTRLLAEHGALGMFAIGILILMVIRVYKTTTNRLSNVWAISLSVYAALFMAASGMRLVAPSMAIGLAMVQIRITGKPSLPGRSTFNAK